jgi:hypothetical protein
MRLRKNNILAGACLSLMCLAASNTAAQAAPKEAETQEMAQAERVAQGRFGGTAAQYEIVGYVKSIAGNVVTIYVEEEATIGVAGIAANDGEPTFVSVAGEELGLVRSIYLPANLLGAIGLVPGMRIYASMSDRGSIDSVDYFKVISAVSYDRIDLGAVRGEIRRQLNSVGSGPVVPRLPEVQPPPPGSFPTRRVAPPPPPAPVPALW